MPTQIPSSFNMIDISDKRETLRTAIATGFISVSEKTLQYIKNRTSPKGDILAIAEVAGIMGIKKTSSLLPLCHPLNISASKIWFEIQNPTTVQCFCRVDCKSSTGVEMEALVGANIALLTIYDLAKAVDPIIKIHSIELIQKIGGKSGVWFNPQYEKSHKFLSALQGTPEKQKLDYSYSVLTLSDRASSGKYEDLSGPILKQFAERFFLHFIDYQVLPDDEAILESHVRRLVKANCSLILVNGGTGIGPRDITPDVLKRLADRELVGFGEKQRLFGSTYTDLAWISRASAFIIEKTLVVLFPGSPKAVHQGICALETLIPHTLKMIRGLNHD